VLRGLSGIIIKGAVEGDGLRSLRGLNY